MVVTVYDQLAVAGIIVENSSLFSSTALNEAVALLEAAILETPSEPEAGP